MQRFGVSMKFFGAEVSLRLLTGRKAFPYLDVERHGSHGGGVISELPQRHYERC